MATGKKPAAPAGKKFDGTLTATQPIKYNGERFEVGAVMEDVDEKSAKALVEMGHAAIGKVKVDAPPDPTAPVTTHDVMAAEAEAAAAEEAKG
jgi:hypothetical protein